MKSMRRGFTLVEMLVTMGIMILIGGAIFTFGRDIFFSNSILSSSLASEDEARGIFKMMSAEIRSASPGATGAYPIAEAATSSLTFYSDLDNDGKTERVRYFLSGNILRRGVIKPTGSPLTYVAGNETLTNAVRNVVNVASEPVFYYFDSSYDGTTASLTQPVDVSAVRLVKISLAIDKDLNRTPGPIIMTTQISLRNLKDNL